MHVSSFQSARLGRRPAGLLAGENVEIGGAGGDAFHSDPDPTYLPLLDVTGIGQERDRITFPSALVRRRLQKLPRAVCQRLRSAIRDRSNRLARKSAGR